LRVIQKFLSKGAALRKGNKKERRKGALLGLGYKLLYSLMRAFFNQSFSSKAELQ